MILSCIAARGFGMRVVGGKTGADGRLFAYIVWTVPGGPAEKGGLQQGDKVITMYTSYSIILVSIPFGTADLLRQQ